MEGRASYFTRRSGREEGQQRGSAEHTELPVPVRSLLHTYIRPTLLQSCRVVVFALGWGWFVFWFCVCFALFVISNSIDTETLFFFHEGLVQILEI